MALAYERARVSGKRTMKDMFGARRVRVDGTEGAEVVMPALDYLQRSRLHVHDWIDYATYDAESTWLLRNELERRLRAMPWRWPDDEIPLKDAELWCVRLACARVFACLTNLRTRVWHEAGSSSASRPRAARWQASERWPLSMFDMYWEQWRPYDVPLEDYVHRARAGGVPALEQIPDISEGVRGLDATRRQDWDAWLDAERLAAITPVAWHERDEKRQQFVDFMQRFCPDVVHMNLESDVQKRQLFFAPCANAKDKSEKLPAVKEFKRLNTEQVVEDGRSKPLKHVPFFIEGLGLPALEHAAGGWPRASSAVLRKLAGNVRDGQYGKAYDAFRKLHGDAEAAGLCHAIDALVDAQAISTLLSTFIEPLQSMADSNGRVRCICDALTARTNAHSAHSCTRRSTSTPRPAVCRRGARICRISRRSTKIGAWWR